MIFITHPEHGCNNVNKAELEECLKHGWVVTDIAEWYGRKSPKPAEQNQDVIQIDTAKKRGRKPKAA